MASNTQQTDSNINQFFYEDEVFYVDKKGMVKFGLVMENFEAAISDNEDNFDDNLRKGEIRVAWHPDGGEQIVCESNVGLADRTLMPGDVVRRLIPGKDTQRGYCRDIIVHADVRVIGTKYIIKNVTADRLRPLITMPKDNAVCFDSWVGSTKTVNEKLILKSTCGSVLELRPDIEWCPLKDTIELKSHGGVFSTSSYYPGQILVGPVSALDNAKWITTSHEMRISRKHKTVDRKFIVQSVEIEGVWVHWQCKALYSEDGTNVCNEGEIQQPKCYITGDELIKMKRLNLFESCMLQINDKNYLKIEEKDTIVRKSQWRKEKSNKYRTIQPNSKLSKIINERKEQENLKLAKNEKSCDTENKLTKIDCDLDNSNLLKTCDKITICSNSNCNTASIIHKERQNETSLTNLNTHKQRNGGNCNNSKLLEADDSWLTENDSNSNSESGTTASSCSSPTPKSSPKRSPLLSKKIKKLRKHNPKSSLPEKMPAVNEEVVTEALVVYSTATVVWQDGTIENGIPSVQLYPIHHLDDHEFFPGDFVLAGNEAIDNSHRDYGVIQKVDHQGRTALVKWFRTYTCLEEPRPSLLGESEVSVYDLKDHPDFQYRPGTIVIRVANFIGEDAACTSGQVIDNYPEGKVKVWWVDGHTSMCWPQDLFEVGQYDADNNFSGNGDSDNDSWETESEISEPGGFVPKKISKPHLATNLERARVAMARLEEIFSIKPNLQNQDIMKKLLGVYKKCRYLDRLMNTTFFHEDHFMGLLERVRKGGNATTAERVQDQITRLFNQTLSGKKSQICDSGFSNSLCKVTLQTPKRKSAESTSSNYSTNRFSHGLSSTPKVEESNSMKNLELSPTKVNTSNLSTSSDISSISDIQPNLNYPNKLFTFVLSNIDKAAQNVASNSTKNQNDLNLEIDSGVCSSKTVDHCDGASTASNVSSLGGCCSKSYIADKLNIQNSDSSSNIQLVDEVPELVCAKLCALIKAQLVKALQEINQRFCESCSLSEIVIEEYELSKDDTKTDENLDSSTKAMDTSVDEIESVISSPVITPVPLECFLILDSAPNTHKFHLTMFQPNNPQQFFKAVRREHKLLKSALPPGVWVRLFEDRMDLLSVMIEGPKNTPYEDGMFLFDIQLGSEYPHTAPMCHYISYCSDRLNPNLYEDGKVCVSLLGTWSGRGSEVWGPNSTLLQVIVSIQGLILVSEPYFNEAGYEKQKGTQQGKENSRMYNEMVILKLLQSMSKLISSPPEIFRDQISRHFKERGKDMYNRIQYWMELSNLYNNENKTDGEDSALAQKIEINRKCTDKISTTQLQAPEFPLVPASRGFCITLAGLLENYYKKLEAICDCD